MSAADFWGAPSAAGLTGSPERLVQEVMRDFLGLNFNSILSPSGAAAYRSPEIETPEVQEPWIWAAMDLGALVVAMSQTTYWLGDPAKPGATQAPRTELQTVLERPVPGADSVWLIQCDWLNLIRSGESFWFLQGPDGQPVQTVGDGPQARIELPTAIWPVDGTLVTEIKDQATGIITHWEAPGAGGKRVRYPAAAVLAQFHRPRKDDPSRGVGPVGAAFGLAAQNYIARRYTDRLLRNDGRVAGVLIVGGNPSPSQVQTMRAELEQHWNNPSAAGKWRLATGEAKVHSEPTTPKDMEFGALLQANKKDIAAVMQTPGALFGEDTTNYATFAGHFKRYLELRIIPWLESRARAINERLVPRLREPRLSVVRVSHDVQRLRSITADPREEAEATRGLVEVGVPIAQALRRAGVRVDDFDGADVPMIAQGRVPLIDAQAQGRAATIQSQAAAAQALIAIGVDANEALQFAGLPLVVVEQPEDGAETPEETEDKEKAGGAKNQPITPVAREVGSAVDTSIAPSVTRYTPTVEDRASSHRERDARRPHVRSMTRSVRGVWWRMRLEQIRVIERFAASGDLPDLSSTPARWFLPRSAAESALVHAAAGTLDRWRSKFPRYAAHPDDRIIAKAFATARGWSEAEIDRLMIAGAKKWVDELAEALKPGMTKAYTESAARTRVNLGSPGRAVPADLLARLRDKAILVAEGSTSSAASAVRAAMLRVLAEKGRDLGSLQAAIREALAEVKAGTTRAFQTLGNRALAIARTEVNGAAAAANYQELLDAYRKGLIRAVRWLTSGRGPEPGGTVRDTHWEMEGQEVVPGSYFANSRGHRTLHPFGFGIASEDINCECRLQGVLAEGGADNSVSLAADDAPDLSSADLAAVVRAHEDEIVRSSKVERGIAVDAKGRTLVAKTGEARHIVWRQPEAKRLRGSIFTHNHPTGYTFAIGDPRRLGSSLSFEDVAFAVKWEVAEVRAVSPGWRHSLRPSSGSWPSQETLRGAFDEVSAEVEREGWAAIGEGASRGERDKVLREQEANYWHWIWQRVAERLGFVYSREPLNA